MYDYQKNKPNFNCFDELECRLILIKTYFMIFGGSNTAKTAFYFSNQEAFGNLSTFMHTGVKIREHTYMTSTQRGGRGVLSKCGR